MKSLNHCQFIGYLGREVELSYTASGTAIAKFSIACGESWTDSDGNKQEKTEWINLVAWKKLAEVCGQYLKKGSRVFVGGKMQTRSWDDKNSGQKRYATEVVIDELLMLDSRQTSSEHSEPTTIQEPEKEDLPF